VFSSDSDLATIGSAIAEPARASMLLRMMDGRAHTARDLAEAAGVSPSAATAHLRRLVEVGMIVVTVSGRRRLHSIASPSVAAAIEALAAISPGLPVESLRQASFGSRLQVARVCYGHLAGGLAVAVTAQLVAAGVIEPLAAGEVGAVRVLRHPLLAALSIAAVPDGPGPEVRGCLDWTEGSVHVSGRLGTTMLTAMLEHGWLASRPRDRALNITDCGARALTKAGVWPLPATETCLVRGIESLRGSGRRAG
jgi:DNA-binding transcriptional ArsR family regulator